MDEKQNAALTQHVMDWFASNNLLQDGRTATVSVVFAAHVPVIVKVNEADGEATLRRALARMSPNQQGRVATVLDHKGITSTDQIIAIHPYHLINCGRKKVAAFAEALLAEGVSCPFTLKWTRKSIARQELERVVVCPLSTRDWNKITKIPWDKDGTAAIQILRKRENRPVALGKLLKRTDGGAEPGMKLNSMNFVFRRHRLPYRLKEVSLSEFGIKKDRFIQIHVLPTE